MKLYVKQGQITRGSANVTAQCPHSLLPGSNTNFHYLSLQPKAIVLINETRDTSTLDQNRVI